MTTANTIQTTRAPQALPHFHGELALVVAVLINSLGVVMMLDSGFGISAISSVPYAFNRVLPALTMGKVIGWIGEWMDKHFLFVVGRAGKPVSKN